MTTHLILTIILIILSAKSIVFLKTYIVLLKLGIRTNGIIVAFEEARHIITKGLIPKVEFQTDKNQPVTGKPIYSWFLELNNYQLERNCVAYYDKSNPIKFVIKSNLELFINFAIVMAALVSLTWLIIVSV